MFTMPLSPAPLHKSHFCVFTGGRGHHTGIGWVGETKKWLVEWNRTIRVETVITTGDHEGTVAAHERFRLNMEVTKHFIRPPSADKADDVGIHTTVQKCHGTRSSERASADVGTGEAVGRA